MIEDIEIKKYEYDQDNNVIVTFPGGEVIFRGGGSRIVEIFPLSLVKLLNDAYRRGYRDGNGNDIMADMYLTYDSMKEQQENAS